MRGWISNLLLFFTLVFTGSFLRSARTVRATLVIFIQAWTTREPCRFLPTECILTAKNLKDFSRSPNLENKILEKETLKTTPKSSYLIAWNEILRFILRCDRRSVCLHIHLTFQSDRFPSEIWRSSLLSLTSMTSTIDDRIFLSRPRCMFMPMYGIGSNETPDNNSNIRVMQIGWVRFFTAL